MSDEQHDPNCDKALYLYCECGGGWVVTHCTLSGEFWLECDRCGAFNADVTVRCSLDLDRDGCIEESVRKLVGGNDGESA